MSWLALVITAVIFLAPIGGLFSQLSASDLLELFHSHAFGRAVGHTLFTGIFASLGSVLFAIVFARKFALQTWRSKRVQRLSLLIPYLIPNFILATAFVLAWNPSSGLLNSVVRFPGGLYGRLGIIVLLAVAHLPVAFLMLETRFQKIDSSLREAARLSGAGVLGLLFRIELPLLMPTLAGAFSLCFALNISAFAIPAWIGAPERVYTLSYKIYQAIEMNGAEGFPRAAGYALILFALVVPVLALGSFAQRNSGRFTLLSGKTSRVSETQSSRAWHLLFQLFFWGWQLLFWIAPMATLVLSTLVPPGCLQQRGLSCLGRTTLHTYHYILVDLEETRLGLSGSLTYGTLSAILIILLSVAALIVFSRSRWSARAADWIFSIPVATPGAIIALGLILTCSGRFGLNLYNTAWIVVAAYVLKHLNLAFQPIKSGYTDLSASLFEAARLSGARTREIWARIVMPILQPEITGAFFLVLVPILGELTMSVFLVSPHFRSIGTVLFDLQDYADQSSAAGLSVVLVLLILILNEATRWISRRKLGY